MDPEQPRDVPGSPPLKDGVRRADDRLGDGARRGADARADYDMPEPIVRFHRVSKWYGPVIGVNNLSLRIFPGVTGLLGPNGAGKSTLLQLATGQLQASQGEVLVLGQQVWNNPGLNRYMGLCPEQDAFWEWMTGRDFVTICARLSGMRRPEATQKANHALEMVGMTPNADRAIRGYSKGMRQRIKL